MKNVKLTQQTARTLIGRITPRLKISKDETAADVAIFRAATGPDGLDIVCENDWFTCNGRISLTVSDRAGGRTLRMYFHPDTLNRDFLAELAEREEEERQARIRWVGKIGLEQAHRLVDRYWES